MIKVGFIKHEYFGNTVDVTLEVEVLLANNGPHTVLSSCHWRLAVYINVKV